MKRLLVSVLLLFSLFSLCAENNDSRLLTAKYQAVAIGELSLAYRLETLSMSLAAAKAVDPEYVTAILGEVDATLTNGKSLILLKNSSPEPMTKEILSLYDLLLSCSSDIKKYAKTANPGNLEIAKRCIAVSQEKVESVSALFEKSQKK